MTFESVILALFDFAFYYPLFMAYVWVTASVYYFFYRERVEMRPYYDPPKLPETPGVTLIVPCHNEAENIRDTIVALLKQDYPDFEVIAINDASTDRTGEILEEMAELSDQLRIIHFETNQGKALGLRAGALAANNEILVCIDGDAILERHATRWLAWHFSQGPRVGAVTGNPPFLVVGYGADRVKEIVGSQAEYVFQAEQLGTGHAVQQAESHGFVEYAGAQFRRQR